MRKTKKIFILLCIIFFIINIFTIVCATVDPDSYNPDSANTITEDDKTKVFNKAGFILGTVRNISVVFSVIALMIIGVKYIIGSAEEKANYKATMMPYIIGCIMAAAGTSLVSYIYNMIN